MVDPVSDKVSLASPYLGNCPTKCPRCRVRGSHPLWPAFPCRSPTENLCNFASYRTQLRTVPATPSWQRRAPWHQLEFRLFPVRSPLLGESLLISFPPGTEMVQFPGFRFACLWIQHAITDSRLLGYPIRPSWDRGICAPPPGLSQLITAFFAVRLRGIHHEPVFA